MIQAGTNLNVADNTGAKSVRCFKILGGSRKRYAYIGEVIMVSVKDASPRGLCKKKSIQKAVIVRQKKDFGRKDGSYIRFDDNAVVIIGADLLPKGTRVFGPIARELREAGFQKIISLAPEVL